MNDNKHNQIHHLMFRKIATTQIRPFWTLSRQKIIGYIESVGSQGLIFTNDFIMFRETSSNLSHGNIFNVSIEKCNNDKQQLTEYMNSRTHVCVECNQQLFSNPTKGNITEQIFATQIYPLEDEILNVSQVNKQSKKLKT